MPTLEEILNNVRSNVDLHGRLNAVRDFIGPEATSTLESIAPTIGNSVWGGFDDYVTNQLQDENFASNGARLKTIGNVGLDLASLYGLGKAGGAILTPLAAGVAGAGRAAAPAVAGGAEWAAKKLGAGGVRAGMSIKNNPLNAAILAATGLNLFGGDGSEAPQQVPQQQAESVAPQEPQSRQLSADDINTIADLREVIRLRGNDSLGSDVGRGFSKAAEGSSARKMSNLGYSDAGDGNYIPKQALGAAMLQSKLKDMEASKPSVKDIRDLKKYRQGRQDKYLEDPRTMMSQRFPKIKGKYAEDTEMFAKLQAIKDALAVAGSQEEANPILSEPGVKELFDMEQQLEKLSAADVLAQKEESDGAGWGPLLAALGIVGAGAYAFKKGKIPKGLLDKLAKTKKVA